MQFIVTLRGPSDINHFHWFRPADIQIIHVMNPMLLFSVHQPPTLSSLINEFERLPVIVRIIVKASDSNFVQKYSLLATTGSWQGFY